MRLDTRTSLIFSTLAAAFVTAVPQSLAQEAPDQSVFFFGGRYSSDYFEFALNPFTTTYENNFVGGVGYQSFFWGEDGGFKLGAEAGAAFRTGNQSSAELWGGAVARADRFIQTDQFAVSASLTLGLSVTTDTIGIEAQRERDEGGNSTLLYYLGPEISLSLPGASNTEVFWRLHHRSGGWKTLGNMRDGANATAIGIRWSF
ncbi:hypothetical protein [Devosia rhizoryzae]|uniref:Outer membrane protein beta-barrel domain-containing protein n=1 Tax=Devosia rhizoryzae TaxID=2774137 RepID=A0ABX7C1I0_9HYPH|nr:hypothetical protein [Devosia rhizoryzae]QQR38089.1 hypothetical protein JI748_09810 [Devosia rhizoryzae]